MTLLLYVLAAALFFVGIAGLVLPALPGGIFLVAGVVTAAWAEDFTRIGWPTILVAVLIAVAMQAIDIAAGMLGVKRSGASGWGIAGAALGAIVGLFFGLPGVVLGPIAGAAALEYAKDPAFRKALSAGLGAAVGFLLGAVGKLVLALILLGIVVLAYFI